jgi:cation:H+ antiporter
MGNTVLLLILGLGILIAGGDFLVRGASALAQRLQISSLVIGLTVVAFGTSAPELIISVQSALIGSPDIAIANVVGSNICNLALVLGLMAVLNPVPVQQASIRYDWPMTMGAALALFFLAGDRLLQRPEGLALLLALVFFVVFTIRNSRNEFKRAEQQSRAMDIPDAAPRHFWLSAGFMAIGVTGLYFGSEWFVASARTLAQELGVGERVIGLTVVAVGTSLPELVTSVMAAFKKDTDMALGNLMGSNVFNVLGILGISSLIVPIEVHPLILGKDMVWMLAITLMVLPLMLIRKDVSRWDGILLLAVYAGYLYFAV